MRTSFLMVIVGTILSFATGTSVGQLAVDSVGVAILLFGCIGVVASLVSMAFAVDGNVPAETVAATD